jgi:hypothetical protein
MDRHQKQLKIRLVLAANKQVSPQKSNEQIAPSISVGEFTMMASAYGLIVFEMIWVSHKILGN